MKFTMSEKKLSYMQLRAIDCWFRNGRKSKAKAIREAGYSEAIARQPHKVFDSPAVQRELELRGHGKLGIKNNQEPQIMEKEVVVRENPEIDLSLISQEDLRKLKESLNSIPDLPNIFEVKDVKSSSTFIPTSGTMDSNFDMTNNQPIYNNEGSYSSM